MKFSRVIEGPVNDLEGEVLNNYKNYTYAGSISREVRPRCPVHLIDIFMSTHDMRSYIREARVSNNVYIVTATYLKEKAQPLMRYCTFQEAKHPSRRLCAQIMSELFVEMEARVRKELLEEEAAYIMEEVFGAGI